MKKQFVIGSSNGGDRYRNKVSGTDQMTLQKNGSSSCGGDKV